MFSFYVFIEMFLVWSLCAYALHRAGHVAHRSNVLFRIHMAHHRTAYPGHIRPRDCLPAPANFLLWFGSLQASADVWITLVLPALVLTALQPMEGKYLLLLVYLYEVFCSELLLDHNPALCGPLTRLFAWGDYHLQHHHHAKTNYGLYITLWDTVFWTRAASRKRAALRTQRAITADAGLAL